MNVFEANDELEAKEEQLKQAIRLLTDAERKQFYHDQSQQLKDPDTYAALTWLCVGGIHHWYLGRYRLFTVEITGMMVAILLLVAGWSLAGLLIILLFALIELPQLFLSQKIVRMRNLEISTAIYQRITQSPRGNKRE